MKKIKMILIAAAIMIIAVGCGKKVERTDVNIAAMKGPTGMGMVKIMDNAANEKTNHNYNFTVVGAADEVSAGLLKGDFDIAAVPATLASVLYNKTEGEIQIMGINTLGVLYIVETGNEINSVEDLKGKDIYSMGYGTTPQYTLNYLLESKGIDPEKDINIEYKSEATEVAAILNGADNAIAMLPQPFITTVMMNNENVRIALDIDKEWRAVGDGEDAVVTGVVVVRKDFLEKNEEVVKDFMKEYEASANFVNDNPEEAGQLIENFDIFKAAVATKAIPFSNITFIKGKEMKDMVNGYLGILHEQNPKAVGGALPADDFYYIP